MPSLVPRLNLLGIQLLSPAPFHLPGARHMGVASWGLESGYNHVSVGGQVCTPEGGAGTGGFSLMVWHPEMETWVTGSHLGRSPAV